MDLSFGNLEGLYPQKAAGGAGRGGAGGRQTVVGGVALTWIRTDRWSTKPKAAAEVETTTSAANRLTVPRFAL